MKVAYNNWHDHGFEIFTAHHGADTGPAGGAILVVHDRCKTDQILARRPDAGDTGFWIGLGVQQIRGVMRGLAPEMGSVAQFGFADLARKGLAAHHHHVRLWRSLPNVEEELGPLERAKHDPRTVAYWRIDEPSPQPSRKGPVSLCCTKRRRGSVTIPRGAVSTGE